MKIIQRVIKVLQALQRKTVNFEEHERAIWQCMAFYFRFVGERARDGWNEDASKRERVQFKKSRDAGLTEEEIYGIADKAERYRELDIQAQLAAAQVKREGQ